MHAVDVEMIDVTLTGGIEGVQGRYTTYTNSIKHDRIKQLKIYEFEHTSTNDVKLVARVRDKY